MFGCNPQLPAPFAFELGFKDCKIIFRHGQVMQHLTEIIIRYPVTPLLTLHALQDIGGLYFQDSAATILIHKLAIQGGMHPRIGRICKHVILVIGHSVLWIIHGE